MPRSVTVEMQSMCGTVDYVLYTAVYRQSVVGDRNENLSSYSGVLAHAYMGNSKGRLDSSTTVTARIPHSVELE